MKLSTAHPLAIALGLLAALACGSEGSSGSSPGGEKIAFSSWSGAIGATYGIYLMNAADGSGQTRLTGDASNAYGPAWSPDGQQLAHVSDATGHAQIYRMDASGGAPPTQVTSTASNEISPTWSPDGLQIAYASDRASKPRPAAPAFEIYVIDRDGSNETQITSDPNPDDSDQPSNESPAWSAATNQIAFASDRDNVGRQSGTDIYVMEADGSNATRLTQTNSPSVDSDPAWSPDGTQIAFTSNRDGNDDIFVMDADGTGQVNLSNSFGADQSPGWSADGTRITFSTYRNAKWEIYVMNASDGSDPQPRGAGSSKWNFSPAWSPSP